MGTSGGERLPVTLLLRLKTLKALKYKVTEKNGRLGLVDPGQRVYEVALVFVQADLDDLVAQVRVLGIHRYKSLGGSVGRERGNGRSDGSGGATFGFGNRRSVRRDAKDIGPKFIARDRAFAGSLDGKAVVGGHGPALIGPLPDNLALDLDGSGKRCLPVCGVNSFLDGGLGHVATIASLSPLSNSFANRAKHDFSIASLHD